MKVPNQSAGVVRSATSRKGSRRGNVIPAQARGRIGAISPVFDVFGDEAGSLAARRRPTGTGNPDLDCALERAKCTINCWLKYRNDPFMEQGCNDSCDAAYRFCRLGGSRGGGGVFIP